MSKNLDNPTTRMAAGILLGQGKTLAMGKASYGSFWVPLKGIGT